MCRSPHLLCYFLALMMLPNSVHAAQWLYQQGKPTPRCKHAQVAVANDGVLVYGGMLNDGSSMDDFWVFNTTLGQFQTQTIEGYQPKPRNSAAIAVIGRTLYVTFGFAKTVIVADFFSINLDSWTVASLPNPPLMSRYRMAFTNIADGFMVLFGLARIGLRNDFWFYNTTLKEWRDVSALNTPPARQAPCCTSLNFTAVVCFGGTLAKSISTNEVAVFDLRFRRWSVVAFDTSAPAPSPRRLAACFYTNNKLYISQGWMTDPSMYQDDMWSMSIDSAATTTTRSSWVKVQFDGGASLPSVDSTFWTPMPTSPPSIFQFGGWSDSGMINSVLSLNPATLALTTLVVNSRVPPGRFGHCNAAYSDSIFVLFGTEAQDDTRSQIGWVYNLTLSTWKSFEVKHRSTGQSVGLLSPSCTVAGNVMFTFGGKKVGGLFSKEFYTYNFGTEVSGIGTLETVYHRTNGEPTPRERWSHSSVYYKDSIIIYGGDAGDFYYDDMWRFDLQTYRWFQVILAKGDNPGYRTFHVMVSSGTYFYIIGGSDGSRSLSDRFQCDLINFCKSKGSNIGEGITAFDTARSNPQALSMVSATPSILIFGGTYDLTAGVLTNIVWDSRAETNSLWTAMPIPAIQTSVVSIADQAYVFGGQDLRENTLYSTLGAFQILSLDSDFGCAFGSQRATSTSQCTLCAIGTYYDPDVGKCVQCATGWTTVQRGLIGRTSCVPRAQNTNNDRKVGNATFRTVMPPTRETPKIPIIIWVLISLLSLGLVGLCLLWLSLYSYRKHNLKSKLLTPAVKEIIQEAYENCEHEITEREVYATLRRWSSNKDEISYVRVHELFSGMDRDGDGRLSMVEFEDMILGAILEPEEPAVEINWAAALKGRSPAEHVHPALFRDTDHEMHHEKEHMVALLKPRMKLLDKLISKHITAEPGFPMFYRSTTAGGLTTLSQVLGAIILTAMLTCVFVLQNEFNELSSVPKVMSRRSTSTRYASFVATMTLVNSGFDSSSTTACSSTLIQLTGDLTRTDEPTSCTFSGTSLIVTYVCTGCKLGSELAVEFIFQHMAAFAERIDVSLIMSAVEDQNSYSESTAYASNNPAYSNLVFRGMETPTDFVAEVFPVELDNFGNVSDGFYGNFKAVKLGGVTQYEAIADTFGLRSRIVLSVEPSVILMKRTHLRTWVEFMQGLVGSLSGFVGFCITVMGVYEKIALHFQHHKDLTTVVRPCERTMDPMGNLVCGGFTLTQARAVLRGIQHEVHSNDMIGRGGGQISFNDSVETTAFKALSSLDTNTSTHLKYQPSDFVDFVPHSGGGGSEMAIIGSSEVPGGIPSGQFHQNQNPLGNAFGMHHAVK